MSNPPEGTTPKRYTPYAGMIDLGIGERVDIYGAFYRAKEGG